MFRAMFSSIVSGPSLYLQHLVVRSPQLLPDGVMDELKLNYVDCEACTSPETCRADLE
jgi:hypothetical protein